MNGLLGFGFALVVALAAAMYLKWVLLNSYNTRTEDE